MPPNIELEYHYNGESVHTFAHFYLANTSTLLKQKWQPIVTSFAMPRFRRFDAALREAAAWSATHPVRAQARLWDLLWEVVALEPRTESDPGDPRVDRALKQIEERLDSRVSVEEIAVDLEISTAQVVRLFHRHVGSTPLAYIIRRRAERAEHLLRHTTQPMKSIARQVGMSDLQQFNKLLRKALGKSPRDIRGG